MSYWFSPFQEKWKKKYSDNHSKDQEGHQHLEINFMRSAVPVVLLLGLNRWEFHGIFFQTKSEQLQKAHSTLADKILRIPYAHCFNQQWNSTEIGS